MIRDLLLIAMIAAGVLGASQVPSLVDQVEQRIGGTLDEADRLLRQFEAVATESRMSFDGYVDWMLANEDARVRLTGERVRDLRARVQELRKVRGRLAAASKFVRPMIALRQVERPILTAAWSDYRPTLTLDIEFGSAGLVLGWLLFGIGGLGGRLLSRVVAPARAPGASRSGGRPVA